MEWDQGRRTHAEMTRMAALVGSLMVAGGDYLRHSQELEAIDEMVSASNGIIGLLMPPGIDVKELDEETQALIREAQKGVDRALVLRHLVEQKRAASATIPAENVLAKSASFGAITERYAIAKARAEDLGAGRLGKVNNAERQAIVREWTAAEMLYIEARNGIQ